jgi:2',3'-cyclic-nucleotide 2'-phosphodiesterase (5'-nucleotidase family)
MSTHPGRGESLFKPFRTDPRAFIALLLLAGLTGGAFHRAPDPPDPQPDQQTAEIRILFTANTLGYIEPCDCASGRLGGLDRRATALSRAREDGRPTLLIDLGNLFELPGRSPTTELGKRQAKFLVEEMNRFGYDLVAVGSKEAVFSPEFLKEYLSPLQAPLLLSNRAPDAGLGVDTVPVKRLEVGGLKIDFFNIIDPEMIVREGLLEPWSASLRSLLTASEEGPDPADMQVVITHLPVGVSDRVPSLFPEVDLILDGTLILPRQAFRIVQTVVMSTAGKGQQIGRLDLTVWNRAERPARRPAVRGFQGLQIRLPLDYPSDPEVRARIEAFRAQLAAEGLVLPPPPERP